MDSLTKALAVVEAALEKRAYDLRVLQIEHLSSIADYFKIIVGEGTENAGKVVIENPLVEFKRTADETSNQSQEFSFKAR